MVAREMPGLPIIRHLAGGLGLLALLCLGVSAFLLSPVASAASNGCLAEPSACGFPDRTNTGVPAGTTLTPAGSQTVSTDGAVLDGLEITGTVTVTADNVTIQNSRIVRTSGGSGSYAVILNNGADNFTIKDTEVVGPESDSEGLQSAVWNHYGNPGATATRVYFHRCADCWEGAGTFRDDYMVVDAAYSGSHDEDIYVCGDRVDVDHSTLVNTHQQTATVFGDTICGPNDFTVTNSLLAGGGFLVYPQANSSSATGTANVSGNRFARCTTSSVYDPGSGGRTCSGGADSFGYYPLGGYYGVAAYNYSGPGNVWANNVWDDSGQPVCDDGTLGCGTATPPPEEEPPVEEPPPPPPPEEEEPPVEEPPAEEPPAEEPEPPVGTPASAVWEAPAEAQVDVPVTLDGTASSGDGPLSCTWSFENESGSIVWETRDGCQIEFTFQQADTKFVRLIVRDANGDIDANRQSFPVSASAPPPPPPVEEPPVEEPAPPEGEPVPPDQPTPLAGPVEASIVAALAPASSAAPHGPVRAIWSVPAGARPGGWVTLDGTDSRGDAPLACAWTIEGARGTHRGRRSGCRIHVRLLRSGTRYVKLTVRDGHGTADVLRRSIRVRERFAHSPSVIRAKQNGRAVSIRRTAR
jgi:hypothetical protein